MPLLYFFKRIIKHIYIKSVCLKAQYVISAPQSEQIIFLAEIMRVDVFIVNTQNHQRKSVYMIQTEMYTDEVIFYH